MAKAKRKRPKLPVCTSDDSENRKTGRMAITYVGQGSCPVTCPFLGCGCYGEGGPIGIITANLNVAGAGWTPAQLAVAEAEAIDRLSATTDLRLHGVGDCRTNQAARTVAAAVTRYLARAAIVSLDVCVFTYTHAQFSVDRESWGSVSVLGSCQSVDEVALTFSRGYAAALVVEEFADGAASYKLHDSENREYTIVPCLWQSRKIQCVDCRLCMDDAKLLAERRVVAFRAHGARRSSVVATLRVLNGE